MGLTTTINLGGLRTLAKLPERVALVPSNMAMWADEYRAKHMIAWESMKYLNLNTGAVSFRGETMWMASPDQYTRKTDGVTVPPWGGVPRIAPGWSGGKRMKKVTGVVQGRGRPSGARVTPNSTMMVDTGRMRGGFLTPRFENNGFRVLFEVPDDAQSYARVQNAWRRFVFMASVDIQALRDRLVYVLKGGANG